MADEPSDAGELSSRPPQRQDLVALARELNRLKAKYVVIGGFAIIQAGLPRTTGDLDLLIAADLENEVRIFQALESLPDQCVKELQPGDVFKYTVVRLADEIVVDLMASASGIDYESASSSIIIRELDGVLIPFASPELLWRMKRHTHREKDKGDLFFLRRLFENQGQTPPD